MTNGGKAAIEAAAEALAKLYGIDWAEAGQDTIRRKFFIDRAKTSIKAYLDALPYHGEGGADLNWPPTHWRPEPASPAQQKQPEPETSLDPKPVLA